MTISELICRLQAIKCEHGDLPVSHREDSLTCGFCPVTSASVEKIRKSSKRYREDYAEGETHVLIS